MSLRLIPWLWPMLLLAVEASRQIVGDTTGWGFWVMRLSDPAWAALSAVLLITVLSIRRWRRAWLPFAAALGLSIVMIAPIIRFERPLPPQFLTVMQLNMQHGLGGLSRVGMMIESEGPDIICFQEAGPLSFYPEKCDPDLRRALAGYRVFHSPYEAIAVRGEVLETKVIDIPEVDYEKALAPQGKVITTVRAEVKGRIYRIATLHFSPRPDPKKGAGDLANVRKSQFEAVLNLVRQSKDRVIVTGDFNSHPVGPNYRSMTAFMKDAFAETGQGTGFTLNSGLPHKRVDYIYSRGVDPYRCRVLKDVVSDHRAVMAWLD